MRTWEYAEQCMLSLNEKDALVVADWLSALSDSGQKNASEPKGKKFELFTSVPFDSGWKIFQGKEAADHIKRLLAFKAKLLAQV